MRGKEKEGREGSGALPVGDMDILACLPPSLDGQDCGRFLTEASGVSRALVTVQDWPLCSRLHLASPASAGRGPWMERPG